jgi:hypothetical protein
MYEDELSVGAHRSRRESQVDDPQDVFSSVLRFDAHLTFLAET